MKKTAVYFLTFIIFIACQDNKNVETNNGSTPVREKIIREEPSQDTSSTLTTEAKKTDKNETVIDKPLNVSENDFSNTVLKSDKIVLVDFWAQWCGPCKMIAPALKEIAKEYAGKAIVAKVDLDKNQNIASNYKIVNIPTLLFFQNGQIVDVAVGAYPKDFYKSKLDQILSKTK
jgi:thioredoxin 1